jgi:branched-chain amino acid transport system permease protein
LDYVAQVLIFVCIFAILAGSFNLLVGYAGLFSIAHAAFFGIGAYVTALLTAPASAVVDTPINLWLAMLLAVGFAAISGLVIAIPALRVSSDYLVVLSFGFQMVVFGIFLNWTEFTGGEGGVPGVPRPGFFGHPLGTPMRFLIFALVVTAICYFLYWRATATPFGRMLRAIREDEVAAQSLGKNVVRTKILAFCFASALAGVGGILFAQYVRLVDPASFQLNTSIDILAMLILGGTGNMMGAALGAAILVILPEVLRFVDIGASFAEQFRQIVFGLLLIVMLRFRSQGLLPEYWVPAFVRRRAENWLQEQTPDLQNSAEIDLLKGILGSSQAETDGREVMAVHEVSKSFGGIQALTNLSISLEAGKVTGLVGPNGAGKTTAFNLMTGFLPPDRGRIFLRGREITRIKPYKLAAMGVSRSFQNLRIFYKMTVLDNVIVSRPRQSGERLWRAICRMPSTDRETRRNRQIAIAILRFVGLHEKALDLAENLSFAEEKLLVLARMLAMEADLLLLDEPASGLDPNSLEGLFAMIRDLVRHGKTICIIEHNLDVIKELSDKIVYLDEGRVFAEGTPEEILSNEELAERYFGT